MKKLLLLISGSFLFVANLQAQAPFSKRWDKTFGGSDMERVMATVQTADGGFLIGGTSASGISGDKSEPARGGFRDFWVVKTDHTGTKLWEKTFGSATDDILYALCQTTDGGYVLAGETYGTGISGDRTQAGKGGHDYWLIKIDAAGNKVWDKVFGGNDLDIVKAVRQTPDGGFLLAGISNSDVSGDKTGPNRSPGGGKPDIWVLKTDAGGLKLWDKTYGGTQAELLEKMELTADGGFVLAGSSNSPVSHEKSQTTRGLYDYWVVKADAGGNKQWDATLGGDQNDYCYAVKQTSDGSYLVGGYTVSGATGDKTQLPKGSSDIWVVKLNPFGTLIGQNAYGTSGIDYLVDLAEAHDTSILLAAHTDAGVNGDKTRPSKGGTDFWILKTDANGTKLGDEVYGGTGNDVPCALVSLADGGFVLAGESGSGVGGDKSQPSQGNTDFWVIRTNGTATSVTEAEALLPVTVFPNPAKAKITLQLAKLKNTDVRVNLCDLSGLPIFQKEFKPAGTAITEEIPLPGLKGMFLLQVTAGGQTSIQKIILE